METLQPFLEKISEKGLNIFGVADPLAWDARMAPARRTEVLFPGTKSILVIGSGGGLLWDNFLEDLKTNPRHLTRERHPLDAYVQRTIESLDSLLGKVQRRWFYSGIESSIHLNFQALAELASMGHRSRLGLMLHPQFGPWMGLRAACFLHSSIHAVQLPTKDFCSECDAPCARACPGKAFEKQTWNADLCVEYRMTEQGCITCASRQACPVGGSHRYSEEELRYHYDPIRFRHELRAAVGVRDEEDQAILPVSAWFQWLGKSH